MAAVHDTRPRPPFDGWPLQEVRGTGFAWVTPNGPAIVSQAIATRGTLELVDAIRDFYDRLVDAGIGRRHPEGVIVHDWRSLTGVDQAAIAQWLRRGNHEGQPFANYRAFIAIDPSPLIRMVLRTAAVTSQMSKSQRSIRFIDDPQPILDEYGVQAPPPNYLQTFLASG